ncbi:hypothetical protein B0182_00745 [Moraxella bovis]|nr:hypothetical protein B0182_00745 [Moraxella bovis]
MARDNTARTMTRQDLIKGLIKIIGRNTDVGTVGMMNVVFENRLFYHAIHDILNLYNTIYSLKILQK